MAEGRKALLTKVLKRLGTIALWVLMLCSIALIVLFVSLNLYLQSNEEKILRKIPGLDDSSISFKEAKVSLFKDFPNATIVLKDFKLQNGKRNKHLESPIKLEEVMLHFSLREWRKKNLEIRELAISGGQINLYTDRNGHSNFKQFISKNDDSTLNIELDNDKLKFNAEHINLIAEDTDFLYEDQTKNLKVELSIHALNSTLNNSVDNRGGSMQIDAKVKTLAFDKELDSFMKGLDLSGKINYKITNQHLDLSSEKLIINNQAFKTQADIGIADSSSTRLVFENSETDLAKTIPILNSKLQNQLAPYKIYGNFYSKLNLDFIPGQKAKVNVDFKLVDNALQVEIINLGKTTLKGQFQNQVPYRVTKSMKAYKSTIAFSEVRTEYDLLSINTPALLVELIPNQGPRIQAALNITGPVEELNQIYESDTYYFEGGQFSLTTNLNEEITKVKELFLQSKASLVLSNTNIYVMPAKAYVPVHSLELHKESKNASFSIVTSNLDKSNEYQIEGFLKNLFAMVLDMRQEVISSDATISANRIDWTDFIQLFGRTKRSGNKLKSEKESKHALKKTLRGIYNKVHPKLALELDTFGYYDLVELYNLKTDVEFEGENELNLNGLRFDLDQGAVSAQAKLNIEDAHTTAIDVSLTAEHINLRRLLPIFNYFNISLLEQEQELPEDFNLEVNLKGLVDDVKGLLPNKSEGHIRFYSENRDDLDARIEFEPAQNSIMGEMTTLVSLKGSPYMFNDYFQNDQFFFQDTGHFLVTLEYEGDVKNFDNLFEKTKGTLRIIDGAVKYKEADVVFPLNDLELSVLDDVASFDLFMYSVDLDRELQVEGQIENISELIYADTNKALSTQVSIYSPILSLSHALFVLDNERGPKIEEKNEILDVKLKQLTLGLLNRFNPTLDISLDTFIVNKNLSVHNLKTGAVLRDSTYLILDQTDFDFHEGHVSLSLVLDLSKENVEPFAAQFKTVDLGLSKTLAALDYLNIQNLKDAELLDGKLSLDLDLVGSFKDLKLQKEKTKALLNFNLFELKLRGISFIDEMARKLYAYRLFHDIKFAPISNLIKINGTRIDIPQMEIQSTGANVFVEGYVDPENETNVWVSFPLDNLMRDTTSVIPDLRGYAATKRKVHLEIFSDDDKIKTKLRWRKKKFYQKRGIIEQYKLDKKRDKEIRKGRK